MKEAIVKEELDSVFIHILPHIAYHPPESVGVFSVGTMADRNKGWEVSGFSIMH